MHSITTAGSDELLKVKFKCSQYPTMIQIYVQNVVGDICNFNKCDENISYEQEKE